MARRWIYNVSADWLEARKSYLTATDIAGLLPAWKRYLKSKDPKKDEKIIPEFAALWASKCSTVEVDTEAPSSAAARGHIMEPWAIESWNAQADPKMHHWDDCVIHNGILGFSPDAMTIAQLDSRCELGVKEYPWLRNADEIMEIKCYENANHMKAVIEDRMEHKELMQVAMAFCVLPNLKKARILWFNPDAPISMHTEVYDADDLHDQCRWITEIAEEYIKQRDKCRKIPHNLKAQCTEKEVWDAYVREMSNNGFTLKG